MALFAVIAFASFEFDDVNFFGFTVAQHFSGDFATGHKGVTDLHGFTGTDHQHLIKVNRIAYFSAEFLKPKYLAFNDSVLLTTLGYDCKYTVFIVHVDRLQPF